MLTGARTLEGSPLVLVREEDAKAAPPLSPEEAALAAAFPVEKRRREWTLGRLAAKAALQRVLEERGEVVAASDLLVLADPSGAPVGWRLSSGVRAPLEIGLSLSHGHGLGAAWALEGGLPGVDVERIRERPPGTFRFYLDERERAPVLALSGEERDAAAVVLWALKEAAWKTLRPGRGVGLIDLAVEIEDASLTRREGRARFSPRGEAVALAGERGVRAIEASFLRDGDMVFAWARA